MSNEFGVTKDTVEIGGGKFIQVDRTTAINTGRFLKDIVYDVTTKKDGEEVEILEITVSEADGKIATKRYYKPRIDGTIIKNKKELEKAINKLNTVVANLTRRFHGDDYVISGTSSFKEYCEKIITDIKKVPGWDKKEMRIKVVLNDGGFPTLPSYAPVFEDVSVPLAESKLKIGPYDKVDPKPIEPDSDISDVDIESGTDKF